MAGVTLKMVCAASVVAALLMTQLSAAVPIGTASGIAVFSYSDSTGAHHESVHQLSSEDVHSIFQRNQGFFWPSIFSRYNSGYNSGYDSGYDSGYNSGYDSGYDSGYNFFRPFPFVGFY